MRSPFFRAKLDSRLFKKRPICTFMRIFPLAAIFSFLDYERAFDGNWDINEAPLVSSDDFQADFDLDNGGEPS